MSPQKDNQPHDLRRAIYRTGARCLTCADCGALWWAPEPPKDGSTLVPESCPGGGPTIQPGFQWIERLPPKELDKINGNLVKYGALVPAQEFIEWAEEKGVVL